jgi:hypothetical protein
MTNMTAASDKLLLLLVVNCTEGRLLPARTVCDFEQALIDALRSQFPEARIIGCYFHFKQATRRRMKAQNIGADAIGIAMSQGALDMFTVVPTDQVDPQGIANVVDKIKRDCATQGIQYSTDK